jgi:hypothetical protein
VGAEQPPPPQVSPDGKFYWDGQRWVPMPGTPAVQSAPPQMSVPPGYALPPTKRSHALRNISCGCLALLLLVIGLGLCGSLGHIPTTGFSNPGESPSSSPISEAEYKASAKTIPYVQLEKDPASLAGTVVVYTGQVVQYDSSTGTSNLRVDVTALGAGFYSDTIWLDVDSSQTGNVFRNTIIKFWGTVVGPYTYTSVTNAQITIPEVNARYVQVVG